MQVIPSEKGDKGIAMASLMALCEEFVLKDTFYEDAERFLTTQNCKVLILMGVKITSKTEAQDHIQRDLLIFAPIETQAQDMPQT